MSRIASHRRRPRIWHVRCTLLIAGWCLAACGARQPVVPLDSPSEAARHRAALATLVISNQTAEPLTIAFQSATPPLQEITIGRVAVAEYARMAPVPAGEPIILIARRADGSELRLAARSFPPDAEWTWQIPQDATFTKPERPN